MDVMYENALRGIFLSIVDGSLNPISMSELDQALLKEVTAENRGFGMHGFKKGMMMPTMNGNQLQSLWWCGVFRVSYLPFYPD